jgi:hypothetical protein
LADSANDAIVCRIKIFKSILEQIAHFERQISIVAKSSTKMSASTEQVRLDDLKRAFAFCRTFLLFLRNGAFRIEQGKLPAFHTHDRDEEMSSSSLYR